MRLIRLGLAAIVGTTLSLVPVPAAAATLLATYAAQVPASAPAGATPTCLMWRTT